MRTATTTVNQPTADDVLSIVDEVLGTNPWIRLGLSAAVGFVVGIAGGSRIVRAGAEIALTVGARRLARHAFDAAFEAGHRDGSRLDARSP